MCVNSALQMNIADEVSKKNAITKTNRVFLATTCIRKGFSYSVVYLNVNNTLKFYPLLGYGSICGTGLRLVIVNNHFYIQATIILSRSQLQLCKIR